MRCGTPSKFVEYGTWLGKSPLGAQGQKAPVQKDFIICLIKAPFSLASSCALGEEDAGAFCHAVGAFLLAEFIRLDA